MRYKSAFRSGIKLAGLSLLAVILYYMVDFDEFTSQLRAFTPSALAIFFVIATIDRLVMAYKWRHLMVALGVYLPLGRYVSTYYVCTLLGFCLPSTIGGEAYRAAKLSCHSDAHSTIASMFMEKIIGTFSTVTYAWLGAIYLIYHLENGDFNPLLTILICFSLLVVLIVTGSFNKGVQHYVIVKIERFRFGKSAKKLIDAYGSYQKQKIALAQNYLIALIESGLQLIITCGIGIVLGIDAPIYMLASVIAVTELVRRTIMVVDSWGIGTSLQILIFGLAGISGADALIMSLLARAIFFIASLPAIVFLMTDQQWRRDIKL